jgi:hypothetical protein
VFEASISVKRSGNQPMSTRNELKPLKALSVDETA